VATHRGSYVPEIDPKEHRLMIHGMVDRPLIFTMDELKRLPYVTRVHFLECIGNRSKPTHKTVQDMHEPMNPRRTTTEPHLCDMKSFPLPN
jgi:sulfane dehydrogenase subunit SoxC